MNARCWHRAAFYVTVIHLAPDITFKGNEWKNRANKIPYCKPEDSGNQVLMRL